MMTHFLLDQMKLNESDVLLLYRNRQLHYENIRDNCMNNIERKKISCRLSAMTHSAEVSFN